jgi:hypothetical protein
MEDFGELGKCIQMGFDVNYHMRANRGCDIGELDRAQGNSTFWGQTFQFKTPSQGVATHVFAAFHPSLDSSGQCIASCSPLSKSLQILIMSDGTEHNGSYLLDSGVVNPEQVQSWARDPIEAKKLWTLSEEIAGQKFEY